MSTGQVSLVNEAMPCEADRADGTRHPSDARGLTERNRLRPSIRKRLGYLGAARQIVAGADGRRWHHRMLRNREIR